MSAIEWLWKHRDVAMAFSCVTISQITLWDFINPRLGVALTSINGLLMAWSALSLKFSKQEPQ